jgi:hypothetical protein
MAVASVFVHQTLLDDKGQPLRPKQFHEVRRHDPGADRPYPIFGIECQHSMLATPSARYWGFPRRQFEHARLLDPEDVARACVESLRLTLERSEFWDGERLQFRSAARPLDYGELTVNTATVAAGQPELPLTTSAYADYVAHIGAYFLAHAINSQRLGYVHLSPREHHFAPKMHALEPGPPPA